eukprot:377779_1
MATLDTTTATFSDYPGPGHYDRCVGYYEQNLFVTGGRYSNYHYDTFYILDTNNNIWSYGTPLPQLTAQHSCNVVDGVLYVIGGQGGDVTFNGPYYDDVFMVFLDDTFGPWIALNNTLSTTKCATRSVVFDKYKLIYVLGGYNGHILNDVDVINTMDKTIKADSNMIYDEYYAKITLLDNIIYVLIDIQVVSIII